MHNLKPIPETRQMYPAFYSTDQAWYRAASEKVFPPGVFVRCGRKLFCNTQKLDAFIDQGGCALPGGWRKEAA